MKIRFFKNRLLHLCTAVFLWMQWGCENVRKWEDATDNIPPGKVTGVKVENLHGGAMITYTKPADNDLLGIKAVYSYREDGEIFESFSSAFRDTIILAGYPDTSEYTVNLYVVDLSRNVSEAEQVTIKPLLPPVELVRKSLKVNETFSGIFCSWENIVEADIAISLYVDTIGGSGMELDDTFFSKAANGKYAFRGFSSKEYSFRIEIRDRWMNYSAPLDTVMTPLFEQQIMGRTDLGALIWQPWGLANRECISRGENIEVSSSGMNFAVVTDNILWSEASWYRPYGVSSRLIDHVPGWPDDNEYAYPGYFSIDMGVPAAYSRFKIWMRARNPIFSGQYATDFELWGTNDPKPLIEEKTNEDRLENLRYWTAWEEIGGTDEWKNDWVCLGDFKTVLPSGAAMSDDVITSEDQEFVRNGFDYGIDPDKTNIPCRYIRFVYKKTNYDLGKRQATSIGELRFFGAYPDGGNDQ